MAQIKLKKKHFFHNYLSFLRLQSIPTGSNASLERNFLTIRDTLPVSINNCPVIKVNYSIVIQAVGVLGSSDKMKIPIIIAIASSMN